MIYLGRRGFDLNRDQLAEFIEQDVEQIIRMFRLKNKSYGNAQDGFYNFRETARRLAAGEPTLEQMFRVNLTLTDKHWVALMQHGAKADEAADRLLDIIVYALMGRAMLAEIGKQLARAELEKLVA